MGLVVSRVYVGALMTSLEMAGVSLTLLKMRPEWRQCLGMYEGDYKGICLCIEQSLNGYTMSRLMVSTLLKGIWLCVQLSIYIYHL